MDADDLLGMYAFIRVKCFERRGSRQAPEATHTLRRHRAAAPYTPKQVAPSQARRLRRAPLRCSARRETAENCRRGNLALQINSALHDLFCKYLSRCCRRGLFAEGGVYTVTNGLHKSSGRARVQHAARRDDDPRLAQASPTWACCRSPRSSTWPISIPPDDQIAASASLQFFSHAQYRTRWSFASPRWLPEGFGATSTTTTRSSAPCATSRGSLVIGLPSRGDDAANGCCSAWRRWQRSDGRVCAFLEPIALT